MPELKPIIQCKYSCKMCGIHRVVISIPARGEEDVVAWLHNVCGTTVAADHARRSPLCNATSMSEFMIPVAHQGEEMKADMKVGAPLGPKKEKKQ